MSAPFSFGTAPAAASESNTADGTQANAPSAAAPFVFAPAPSSPFAFTAPAPSSPFHFAPTSPAVNPFASGGFGSPAAPPAAAAAAPVNPFATFAVPAFGVASPNAVTAAPTAAAAGAGAAAASPFTPFVFAPTQPVAFGAAAAPTAATAAAPPSPVAAAAAPFVIPPPVPASAAPAAAAAAVPTPAPSAPLPEIPSPDLFNAPLPSVVFASPSFAASTRLLYHDVLQHVFLFLSLRELHVAHSVCREWQSTIVRMARPIQARVEVVARDRCSNGGETLQQQAERIAYYRRLCGSPLAQKHVRSLCNWLVPYALLPEQLPMVSRCLTQLRELRFCVAPHRAGDLGVDALSFPPHLEIVQVTAVHAKEAQMVTVVQALAELQSLRELELISNVAPPLVPLARCPALRTLRLNCPVTHGFVLEARSLHSLRSLHFDCPNVTPAFVFPPAGEVAGAVWGPPLEELGVVPFNDAMATKFVEKLWASLTALRPWKMECSSLEWLARLPKLSSLRVQFPSSNLAVGEVSPCVQMCPGLTSLELGHMSLTSPTLETLLASLPSLRSLSLLHITNLDSLEFLSRGWAPENLQRLVMLHDHVHAAFGEEDLGHLMKLRALTSLRMVPWLFRRPVDLALRAAFFHPLRAMPLLTHKHLDTTYDPSRD